MKGFTIIELVIVIVILIIIAIAVTVIRWPPASIELNIQTQQVASDIRYAQSLSMSMNKRYRIYFYTNDYSIKDNNDISVTHPATHTSNNITLGAGISFAKPPTPNCIAFDARGTPCDCISGSVLGDSTVSLVVGAETDNITVKQTTGYAATND